MQKNRISGLEAGPKFSTSGPRQSLNSIKIKLCILKKGNKFIKNFKINIDFRKLQHF